MNMDIMLFHVNMEAPALILYSFVNPFECHADLPFASRLSSPQSWASQLRELQLPAAKRNRNEPTPMGRMIFSLI